MDMDKEGATLKNVRGSNIMQDFLWGRDCFGERDVIGHGYGQRGSNIEECKGIKHSWTKKAYK
jgi:hypothetical protein